MARLQRRKSQSEKKKRRDKKTEQSSPINSTDAKGSDVSIGKGKDLSKISTFPKKKPLVSNKSASGKQKQNIIDKSMQFLREVRVELKKVTWPSRKQTIGSTAVVIVLVILIAVFLGLVDMGLSNLIRVILGQ